MATTSSPARRRSSQPLGGTWSCRLLALLVALLSGISWAQEPGEPEPFVVSEVPGRSYAAVEPTPYQHRYTERYHYETDPVWMATGEFYYTKTDLKARGRGLHFAQTRTYRSQVEYDGPMGHKWDFVYNERVEAEIDPDTKEIELLRFYDGSGRCDVFYPWNSPIFQSPTVVSAQPTPLNPFGPHPTFQPPTPVQMQMPPPQFHPAPDSGLTELFETGDGHLVRSTADLTRYHYEMVLSESQWALDVQSANLDYITALYGPTPHSNPTRPQGTALDAIDANEKHYRLFKIVDKYGNTVHLQYDQFAGVPRPTGARVPSIYDKLVKVTTPTGHEFTYDYHTTPGGSYGRLKSVTDYSGRVVSYGYSDGGDLVSIDELPGSPLRATTAISYYGPGDPDGAPHAIATITNPEEVAQPDPADQIPYLHAFYDGTRMRRIRIGEGYYSFSWTYHSQPGPAGPRVRIATVVDRVGGRTDYEFDTAGSLAKRRVHSEGKVFEEEYTWRLGRTIELLHSPRDLATPSERVRETWVFDDENPDPRRRGDQLVHAFAPSITTNGEQPYAVSYSSYHPAYGVPLTTIDPSGIRSEQTITPIGGSASTLPTGYVTTETVYPNAQGGSSPLVTTVYLDQFGRHYRTESPIGTTEFDYHGVTSNVYHEYQDPDGVNALMKTKTYDVWGNLTGLVNARGKSWQYGFDARGRQTAIIHPGGQYVETFEYDRNDRVVRATWPKQPGVVLEKRSIYDTLGNVIEEVVQEGTPEERRSTSEYDAEERLVRMTDGEGRVIEFEWNHRNKVSKVVHGAGTSLRSEELRFYNDEGRLARAVDAGGDEWTYEYDGHRRQIAAVDPCGIRHVTLHDGTQRSGTAVIDEHGVVVREHLYDLNGFNQVIQEHFLALDAPGGNPIGPTGYATVSSTYDAVGRLQSSTDALGRTTHYRRDALNRLDAMWDDVGNRLDIVYEGHSHLVRRRTSTEVTQPQTGPAKITVEAFTYDDLGRKVSSTDGLGQVSRTVLDFAGKMLEATDSGGNQIEYEYDAYGDLVRMMIRDPSGTILKEVEKEYDRTGRLLLVRDGIGSEITYGHDARGRLVSEDLPDGFSRRWDYHLDGNVHHYWDQRGTRITYLYDGCDRTRTLLIEPGEGVEGDTRRIDWSWTAADEVASVSDGYTTVTRAYNTLGKQTTETTVIGSGPARTSSSSYDVGGRRTSLTYPVVEAGNISLDYTYNATDAVETITEAWRGQSTLLASYTYQGASRLIRADYGNGVHLDLTHDGRNALTSVRYVDAGTGNPIQSSDVVYDSAGQAVWCNLEQFGGGTSYLVKVDHFDFDAAQRQTDSYHGVTNPSWSQITPTSQPAAFASHDHYDYSPIDTRSRVFRTAGTVQDIETYDLTPGLEYAQATVGGIPTTFANDRSGSRTSEVAGTAQVEYGYDFRRRLVRVTLADGTTVRYRYDAFGRRVEETWEPPSGSPRTFRFYHDDQTAVQEVEVLTGRSGEFEQPAFSNVFSVEGAAPFYMRHHPPSGTGPDTPLWTTVDVGSNVVQLLDETGAVVEHYRYDRDSGEVTLHAGTSSTPVAPSTLIGQRFLWKSTRFEPLAYEHGKVLYEFGGREWDVVTGRPLQRDPASPPTFATDIPTAAMTNLRGSFPRFPGSPGPSPVIGRPTDQRKGSNDWLIGPTPGGKKKGGGPVDDGGRDRSPHGGDGVGGGGSSGPGGGTPGGTTPGTPGSSNRSDGGKVFTLDELVPDKDERERLQREATARARLLRSLLDSLPVDYVLNVVFYQVDGVWNYDILVGFAPKTPDSNRSEQDIVEIGKAVLDVGGMLLPEPFAAVSDIASGTISLGQFVAGGNLGDLADAGIAYAAAIPVLGVFVTGAKTTDNVVDVVKATGKITGKGTLDALDKADNFWDVIRAIGKYHDEVRDALESVIDVERFRIIGKEINVKTPDGVTRLDLLIENRSTRELLGIEVKTGSSAGRNTAQRAKHELINSKPDVGEIAPGKAGDDAGRIVDAVFEFNFDGFSSYINGGGDAIRSAFGRAFGG